MTDLNNYKCKSFLGFLSAQKELLKQKLAKSFPIGRYARKCITQNLKLPVTNFDELAWQISGEDERKKPHGHLLPNSVRAIFCGPSNCGKTNTLLTLITHPNGLRFENVYIYSKSLKQPKYVFLKRILESVDGVKYFPFDEHEHVVTLRAMPFQIQ